MIKAKDPVLESAIFAEKNFIGSAIMAINNGDMRLDEVLPLLRPDALQHDEFACQAYRAFWRLAQKPVLPDGYRETFREALSADLSVNWSRFDPKEFDYLQGLGVPEHVRFYADRVANSRAKELLAQAMLRVIHQAATNPALTADEAKTIAFAELEKVSTGSIDVQGASLTDAKKVFCATLSSSEQHRIHPTPWKNLNTLLKGGFEDGELVIIAARPGLGKTTMALHIADQLSLNGEAVLFISLEMLPDQLAAKIVARHTRIDNMLFRQGKNREQFIPVVLEDIGNTDKQPMWIKSARTPDEVYRIANSLPQRVDLIVVDYLQLLHPDYKAERRDLEIASMTKRFKEIATNLRIPVIVLSQLSRALEKEERSGIRLPKLSDLRESGAIEQDADTVIALHAVTEDRHEVESDEHCGVIKGRNCGEGACMLKFRKPFSEFVDSDMPVEEYLAKLQSGKKDERKRLPD